MRVDGSISFHLSKLSNAKFSILYDISGERLKEKIMADHSRVGKVKIVLACALVATGSHSQKIQTRVGVYRLVSRLMVRSK